MAWTSSHGQTTWPCQFGRIEARLTGVSHGRVLVEPKQSPIQKRALLRALRHSKAYKYTLEEEKRGATEEEVANCSRKAD
ncbi:Tyrosine recombinase XerD [Gossypium arboreum]|uniref:Tyrosine recombinase XerD n=1 Tax=Gossypium arboreum TaxID=29729 RepID=A0A0B0MIV2_GOSAR|nr:Tyrosine recombinase XerD [Gossypium arboreum]